VAFVRRHLLIGMNQFHLTIFKFWRDRGIGLGPSLPRFSVRRRRPAVYAAAA
jgi:hypothetical protein